jgi:hypothetical protein
MDSLDEKTRRKKSCAIVPLIRKTLENPSAVNTVEQ